MTEKNQIQNTEIDAEETSAFGQMTAEKKGSETQDILGEENLIQFVVFNLEDEEFGVDIEQVKEIIKVAKITPLPDSPDFIRGLTNVRGDIIAVIDLKKRFFLSTEGKEASKHVIITREQKNILGILVDEVTEVLRVSQKTIKPTPEIVTAIHKKYMSGVITVKDRLIVLLDLKKVLSEEELEKLAEFQSHVLEKKGPQLKKGMEETEVQDMGRLKTRKIKTPGKKASAYALKTPKRKKPKEK